MRAQICKNDHEICSVVKIDALTKFTMKILIKLKMQFQWPLIYLLDFLTAETVYAAFSFTHTTHNKCVIRKVNNLPW